MTARPPAGDPLYKEGGGEVEVKKNCDNNFNEITTIIANSKERIIICASLKHYLDLVKQYLPEKDINTIANMINTLEGGAKNGS